METSALVPVLLLLLWAAAPSSAATALSDGAAADALPLLEGTVHELLVRYGLPRGLLPATVTDYSLDANGEFVVKLPYYCDVRFSDHRFQYHCTIRGKLSYGRISDISPMRIQVKKPSGIWYPITGIVAAPDGKAIEFRSEFHSDSLPASLFAEIRTCINKKGSSCSPAAAAVEVA